MAEQSNELDLGAVLRALRRKADLSQRELAALAGVPKSTLSRIEAGRATDPKFRTVERLVLAAGGRLGFGELATDPNQGELATDPNEGMRDAAGRHYPAHLDVREVHEPKDWAGAWWAYWYDLPPERWPLRVPAATYDLSRERRNRRRWREEVRRTVRLRRVNKDLPAEVWQWVAELPDGRMVGELRARVRTERPIYQDLAVGGYPASDRGPTGGEDFAAREVLLIGVVVAPSCRALGIGRRLIGELTMEMDRTGLVVARVTTDLGDASGFLMSCGFRLAAWRPLALTLSRR